MKRRAGLALAAIFLFAGRPAANAEDLPKLRVGTPAVVNFTFLPLEVGKKEGFFAKYGVDVEIVPFQGGSRLQQGMIAGEIDLATTSGTEMAFTAKGVPDIAVAATAGPPLFLCVIVPYDSPAKGPDDLKGKKIAVTTDGSFTAWLMRRFAKEKHWGDDGITPVAVGANPQAYVAAFKTHEVDAAVQAPALAFQMEEARVGRMLFPASEIVHAFLSNAIFASDSVLRERPGDVRHFIRGWFETIAYMRGHKAETVAISRALNRYDEDVASREYDTVMPMFLTKGNFDRAALKALQTSFVEMGMVKEAPNMSSLYTEAYLPGK
jgi:NitT/TauT family transport system substrate-binding protein